MAHLKVGPHSVDSAPEGRPSLTHPAAVSESSLCFFRQVPPCTHLFIPTLWLQ
ncbi:hypothetical protein PISMIDRAFT_680458 [Pisolithus microcarpus 441]|uniref:Uncharacterized protein n=1 Tax=Pisolithus microcarpus 441 TaxID=765257 RepID=A0A0C9ZIT2_9AGAM|nr:hypothetical protein PISMIDRAFT_680458 [Pisolithus microcarpus 441]